MLRSPRSRRQSDEVTAPGNPRSAGHGRHRHLEVFLLGGLPEDQALQLATPK